MGPGALKLESRHPLKVTTQGGVTVSAEMIDVTSPVNDGKLRDDDDFSAIAGGLLESSSGLLLP